MGVPHIPSTGARVLIVKLSSLGDLFHAVPAVRQLKQNLNATVDWVTQPEYVPLVKCFTDVDQVIPFPRRNFFGAFPEFWRAVRQQQYDLVVDLQGLFKSALVTRCARSGFRIGPSYAREGSLLFYQAVAGPWKRDRHAVDQALDVIKWFGWPVAAPEFPVAFPASVRIEPRPHIALAPCSRWHTKNWPPAKFIELGRRLLAQTGGTVFLVGGKEDHAVCSEIHHALGAQAVNLCGQTSLIDLGGVLQAMDLAVTVDSGPMHLASAVGTPVVAVFGATNPGRTGPYGLKTQVITATGPECRPCLSRTCSRHDLACLENVSVDEVCAAALKVLPVKPQG